MPETWRLRSLDAEDAQAVRSIFNHYVEHSFAAYAQRVLSLDDIGKLLSQCRGYPALAAEGEDGDLIGFCFLLPYSPHDTFAKTAMITYFIAPQHTREGLGSAFLRRLEVEAQEMGIIRLLAHVSSRNESSLAFHRKHGFVQCGVFHDIGCKRGVAFDVVWFEKHLDEPGR